MRPNRRCRAKDLHEYGRGRSARCGSPPAKAQAARRRPLPPRPQALTHARIPPQPHRARLDPLFHRRRSDRVWNVRGFLSCGSGLARIAGRARDRGRRARRSAEPDSRRRARRRGRLEARARRVRHPHDQHRSGDPRHGANSDPGVCRRDPARNDGRHHHAGNRRHQPWPGRTARDVAADRPQFRICRSGHRLDGRPLKGSSAASWQPRPSSWSPPACARRP